jgi:hypothetical protein
MADHKSDQRKELAFCRWATAPKELTASSFPPLNFFSQTGREIEGGNIILKSGVL